MAKMTLNKIGEMIGGLGETIDRLAISVKVGFDHVDERFNKVDKRFVEIEKTMEQNHEDLILKLDHRANTINVNTLEKRVDKIEKKIGIE